MILFNDVQELLERQETNVILVLFLNGAVLNSQAYSVKSAPLLLLVCHRPALTVFSGQIQKLPDWNRKSWDESVEMKRWSWTKALRCDKLLLFFCHSHRVFSQTAFWFVVLPLDGLLLSGSYGWPCVLPPAAFYYTDTDTEWQTHYLCLRLCVCLLMCDNANITLAMSSPGMLSADTRFTPDCWKRKQVSSEWTGQGSSAQQQPFTAVTQTPFLPSILHNPALNFQTFDLWSEKERERECVRMWAKKALMLCWICFVDWMYSNAMLMRFRLLFTPLYLHASMLK